MKIFFFLTCFFPFAAAAQSNFTSAGGEYKGEGGTVSQSFGQLSFATMSSDELSISEGVIQVFDIAVLSGAENNAIQLFYNAYPNPVHETLTLSVENYNGEALEYQIFDSNGRLISKGQVENKLTAISTLDLIPASYILHVLKNGKAEKSFKIVKI